MTSQPESSGVLVDGQNGVGSPVVSRGESDVLDAPICRLNRLTEDLVAFFNVRKPSILIWGEEEWGRARLQDERFEFVEYTERPLQFKFLVWSQGIINWGSDIKRTAQSRASADAI